MAGYMTKQTHNMYEGEFLNTTGYYIENGTILALNSHKLELPSNFDSKFLCREKTTIYDGIPAYRFVVMKLVGPHYFVDNNADVEGYGEYDATTYATQPGKALRAHPLQVGEEFVVAVNQDLTVGDLYSVESNGTFNGHAE